MRAFADADVWETIRHHLVMMLRERDGREPSPTAAILDTQTVKTTEKGGLAATTRPSRLNGRKRHILVHLGLILAVVVHAADIQDADGAGDLLRQLKRLDPWLKVVFADSVYDRLAALLACFLLGLTLVVIRRLAGTEGFAVVPRRWVAERTLGWLGRWRRLAKEYEELPEVSETMLKLAMIRLMLHRLAHPNRKRLPTP